jgi:hypothetical protein
MIIDMKSKPQMEDTMDIDDTCVILNDLKHQSSVL